MRARDGEGKNALVWIGDAYGWSKKSTMLQIGTLCVTDGGTSAAAAVLGGAAQGSWGGGSLRSKDPRRHGWQNDFMDDGLMIWSSIRRQFASHALYQLI